ncbi:MAG TPA: 50S ribosomal protein L21 [Sphingomonadaceae bacterium]|nr:50S ribosomal protein L21 [Sphingomonadaceae bacterium]
MFAVVRTGGKQYRVAAGDKIVVEKMAGAAGETVSLGDVLFAGEGAEVRDVAGLTVSAEIIAQAKADKVIVFKKRRRHNYRRKNGHRQQLTILRITAIGDEQAPSRAAQQTAPVADDAVDTAPVTASADAGTDGPAADAPTAVSPKAARKPKPQAPLKVDGAESAMTDSPVSTKSDSDEA